MERDTFAMRFAGYKVDPLLHAFYVLQHPEVLQAEPIVYFEGAWVGDFEMLPPGVFTYSEDDAMLLDPNTDTSVKERFIFDQFYPIARALRLHDSTEPYGILVSFCAESIDDVARATYVQPGEDFDVTMVLPEKAIVEEMIVKWSGDQFYPCHALRTYIESLVN